MRYVRIFLLHFQDAFEDRGRSFVWFLLSLFNPLLVLLFWRGAFQSGASPLEGWSYHAIATYYLLIVVAGSFLEVHIEEEIARRDVQSGDLVKYLIRPFPYILMKFFTELPWRIIQGSFGVAVLIFFSFYFKNELTFIQDINAIALAVVTIILGLFISFFYKMIVGLTSLWITEFGGLHELLGVIEIVFAGFIMPLILLPPVVKTIAFALPFAYWIYFPVIALLGKLTYMDFFRVVSMQLFWLLSFVLLYRWLWKKGITKFTGLGQ